MALSGHLGRGFCEKTDETGVFSGKGVAMSWVFTARGSVATRRRREFGAVAVEFALVLPLLLALVFGIIQFGFVLAQQNSLNGAVRTGARYGSVNAFSGSHTCANVITRVETSAQTIGLDTDLIEVKVKREDPSGETLVCETGGASVSTPPCEDSSAVAGNLPDLAVEATYKSEFLVPLPLPGDSVTLRSKGVYQCEYH
jgi:hypothetical protein